MHTLKICIFFRTDHCVIKSSFPAGSLDPYSGDLALEEDVSSLPVMTLREAVRLVGPKAVVVTCNCGSGCRNDRCSCKRAGQQCMGECHRGKHCYNKRYWISLQIRFFTVFLCVVLSFIVQVNRPKNKL